LMKKRARRLFVLLAVALMLVIAVRLVPHWRRQASRQGQEDGSGWVASGVISAEEIRLSSSVGGHIAAVYATEGDRVGAGQALLALDASLLDAQLDAAEAQLRVAEAILRQAASGSRPGAIAIAEAQLAQARAGNQAALQGLTDAQALRDNPQELQLQIAVAGAQVEAAEYRLQSAIAAKDAAEVAKGAAAFVGTQIHDWRLPVPPPQIPDELRYATYEWWQAWAGVEAATASLEDAKAQLGYWLSVRANPQELDAQVAMSEATVAQAAAAVEAAQAQLDGYKAGATEEQLAVARSRVSQAQAALDTLSQRREEMVIIAPVTGTVLSRVAHAGEVAAPGGTLLTVADLAELKLTVYVAENQLGLVGLKQTVLVTVDAFPGQEFEGWVSHIADQAQYTPRNVATKQERATTVYGVDIVLPNAAGLLKPGMSADATFVQ
jgi:multidrug resistance efflux pump